MSKTFEELLTDWQELNKQRAIINRREAELRKTLFNAAFPNPTEGVNTLELADGRILKATHKINRTVDEAALPAVREQLPKITNEISADDIFRAKHSLLAAPYKKITDKKILKVLNMAIVSKPGTPAMEVI